MWLQNRRAGIGLVEILLVVAMIAIIAGYLFPVFAKARAEAKETQCRSNLHQIGMMLAAYYTEHGSLPSRWQDAGISPSIMVCPDTGQPYDYPLYFNPKGKGSEILIQSWQEFLSGFYDLETVPIVRCKSHPDPRQYYAKVGGTPAYEKGKQASCLSVFLDGHVGYGPLTTMLDVRKLDWGQRIGLVPRFGKEGSK